MDRMVDCLPGTYQGGEEMIGFERWAEAKGLYRHGWSIRKIAQELGMDRKTVRKVLSQERPEPYRRTVRKPSILAPFMDLLVRRAPEVDYCAQRLFLELKELGYKGSYNQVKRAVRPLREERRWLEEATVRFETPPGQQAQADWTSAWAWIGEERRRVHLFAMVLGYSRCLYGEFTEDEKLPALLRCHEHAFDWFGGLPQEILYDNPKTVVLRRDMEGKHIVWNPTFWDFVGYYGLIPRLCRPYWPRTKGKIESGVRYIKRSFLPGRRFTSLEDLNAQLWEWLRRVADQRVHGTTNRKPAELFLEEKLRFRDGRPPYRIQISLVRRVSRDLLVSVEGNLYSVPAPYVGAWVEVQAGPEDSIEVYHQGVLIVRHRRSWERHQRVIDPKHYQELLWRGKLEKAEKSALPPFPTLWKVSEPEVEIRDLAVYEAVACGEGSYG